MQSILADCVGAASRSAERPSARRNCNFYFRAPRVISLITRIIPIRGVPRLIRIYATYRPRNPSSRAGNTGVRLRPERRSPSFRSLHCVLKRRRGRINALPYPVIRLVSRPSTSARLSLRDRKFLIYSAVSDEPRATFLGTWQRGGVSS